MASSPTRKASYSYVKRMQTMFYLLDTNKDCRLTKDELFEAQRKAYEKTDIYYRNIHNTGDEAWETMFPEDRADFDQFLDVHTRALKEEPWRRKLEEVYEPTFERQFQTIDLNKDGYVCLREYKKHVNSYWMEPKNADEIAETQFREIDTNKDGLISVDEYVAWQQRYVLSDNALDPIDLWGWLVPDEEWKRYHKQ